MSMSKPIQVLIDEGDLYDGGLPCVEEIGIHLTAADNVGQVMEVLDWCFMHRHSLKVNGVVLYNPYENTPQPEHSVTVALLDSLENHHV